MARVRNGEVEDNDGKERASNQEASDAKILDINGEMRALEAQKKEITDQLKDLRLGIREQDMSIEAFNLVRSIAAMDDQKAKAKRVAHLKRALSLFDVGVLEPSMQMAFDLDGAAEGGDASHGLH